MSDKSILHSKTPFRGSETTQLDISLGLKNWFIHKTIILSPFIIILLLITLYKFMLLINLMSNNQNIDDFQFIDNTFLYAIGAGLVLSFTIGIRLGNKWNKAIKEADELITKDEYIRGSKLVCVDEFNKQFKDEKEVLKFAIQIKECKRKF